MHLSAPTPILRSFAEDKAREFYIDFLGFSVVFEHRFEASAPLYMGIRRGDCVLHLSEHYGDAAPGTSIRIECEDVEALHAELIGKAYRYARPGIEETSWGTREVRVGDPFGNRLIFFTRASAG